MDVLTKILNEPLFLSIAILLSIFLLYSLLKKIFQLFSIVVILIICYVLYLTQIEGVSYKEASEKTANLGKEILNESKNKIDEYKEGMIGKIIQNDD